MTTTVLNKIISEVDNTIPDNSKYNTAQKDNKLTAEHFEARLKPVDFVNKTQFDN